MNARTAPLLILLVLGGCAETGLICPAGEVEDDLGECVPDPVDAGGEIDAGVDAAPDGGARCEPACEGTTPHCVEVQPDVFECVQCVEGADCASGFCSDTHQCLECEDHGDCANPMLAQCNDAGQCVACELPNHCSGRDDGNTICAAGACVECTPGELEGCGGNACRPDGTCSEFPTDQGACLPCDTDANCADGHLCIEMTFGTPAEPVGSFCLWRRDATGLAAPNGVCGLGSQPYAREIPNAMSVDDVTADVCTLATTTCPARLQYRTGVPGCEVAGEDDDACGVEGLNDGRCRENTGGMPRCTYPCLNTEDCPMGSTCPITGDQVCSI